MRVDGPRADWPRSKRTLRAASPGTLLRAELLEDIGFGKSALVVRFNTVAVTPQLQSKDYWIAQRENILWFFHRPGVQIWWKEKRLAFGQSFRHFLESSSPAELKSPANRRV